MSARLVVTSYLIVQAFATAAWWGCLVLVPASAKWFIPAAWPIETLRGFWLADALMLVGGSLFTAAAVHFRKPWATTAIWSLAAAAWYPTLYCIGVSIQSGEAWIASSLMVAMAGLTLAMATIHGTATQTPATIRVTPMTTTTALAWTFAQTVIFWSVFLWILPRGIVELESHLVWPAFEHHGQSWLPWALFAVASVLGAWSGITMAILGSGTPLPTATAPQLVVRGPYRWVRNPMALAGILQGLAVGWFLGSYGVLVYSLTGGVVWHIFVRPVEEADLANRFGESYATYKNHTRLWLPRLIAPRVTVSH